jgi:hypothetical protein
VGISINSANASVLSTLGAHLNTVALKQDSRSADASPSPTSLTPLDPKAGAAKVAKALKALSLNLKLGSDAKDIATALVPLMQSLILQRPDLANAQFDFMSDNGSIKVTSDTLSDSDRTWLQTLLNGNWGLVQAVKTFHDDAVASYSTAADASGNALTQAQTNAVSQKADALVSFMNLFKQFGQGSEGFLNPYDTFYAPNGARIDVSQDSDSAIGLLSFMQSAQALAAGTVKDVDSSGRVFYGTKINIFDNSEAIPQFFPPDASSRGVNGAA